MNDRPTPETDAQLLTVAQRIDTNYLREMVYADIARKLERERDQARDALRVRMKGWTCDECKNAIDWVNGHAETGRHYKTEREVMK